MKYLIALLIISILSCNESYDSPNSTTDSSKLDNMPIVAPEAIDTSRVVTPPPTGDSNVVNTDTATKNR